MYSTPGLQTQLNNISGSRRLGSTTSKNPNKGKSIVPLIHNTPKGRTKGPNHDHHCSKTPPMFEENCLSLPRTHLWVCLVHMQCKTGSNSEMSALPVSAREPMNLLVTVDLHTHQIFDGIKSILRHTLSSCLVRKLKETN